MRCAGRDRMAQRLAQLCGGRAVPAYWDTHAQKYSKQNILLTTSNVCASKARGTTFGAMPNYRWLLDRLINWTNFASERNPTLPILQGGSQLWGVTTELLGHTCTEHGFKTDFSKLMPAPPSIFFYYHEILMTQKDAVVVQNMYFWIIGTETADRK